jgi:hypothetical protein
MIKRRERRELEKSMKTRSEDAFERFLIGNNLVFEKIREDASPRPDYLVQVGAVQLIFEVKELAEDENLKDRAGVHTITTGDHIRRKIDGSRRQIQYGAKQGVPSILLIYNNMDPLQLLGASDRDFIAAMYGEYTLLLNRSTNKSVDRFNGKNQSLQERKNTSFSALGRLFDRTGKTMLTLFENVFSRVQVPYGELPSCFRVRRAEISRDPLQIA